VLCTTRGPKLRVAVADFDCLSAHTNFILRPKDPTELHPKVLEAVVRSQGFQDHLRKHFRGSTNLFVNWSDAERYELTLPPPPEQRRLADALLRMEEVGEALRGAEVAGSELILATLSRAFGTDLLERGPVVWLKERDSEISSSTGRFRPLEEVVAEVIDYRGRTPPYDETGSVPVVSQEDVQDGALMPTTKWVTEATANNWIHRGLPHGGDVVFRMERFPGEVARLPNRRQILTRGVFGLRADQAVLTSEYLYWYLYWLKQGGYWRLHSHATTVPRLYKKEVLATPVCLLTPDGQKELLLAVQGIESGVAALRERIKQQSLLQGAFLDRWMGEVA
jgi:hypothetical protein